MDTDTAQLPPGKPGGPGEPGAASTPGAPGTGPGDGAALIAGLIGALHAAAALRIAGARLQPDPAR